MKNDLIDRIANLFYRHWIWKVIIIFMPSVWFPVVVKYLGVGLWLVLAGENGEQSLTPFGWFFTVCIYALSFIVLLISSRDKTTQRLQKEIETLHTEIGSLRNTNAYYNKVISAVHAGQKAKSRLIIDEACDYIREGILPYDSSDDPITQLKNLSERITDCFCDLTGISRDCIVVSMAYQLHKVKSEGDVIEQGDTDGEWQWVDAYAVYRGLPLKTLATDPKAVFHQLLSGEKPTLYYNSKAEKLKENMYIPDGKDGEHHNNGSIVCWNIDSKISESVSLGRLVVSISSYGSMFAKHNSDEIGRVEESLKVIYRLFEEQIATELTHLCILRDAEAKRSQMMVHLKNKVI